MRDFNNIEQCQMNMILELHGSLEVIRVLKPYSIVTLGDMEAYSQVHLE